MKDFGVTGSEDIILLKCLRDGSKHLTKGFVIKPNTCQRFSPIRLLEISKTLKPTDGNAVLHFLQSLLTTVLKSTTEIVLVIIIEFPRN